MSVYLIGTLDTKGHEVAFVRSLLDRYGVAVLPCDGFGPSGAGLLRVSLCVSRDKLVVAAERIVEYVETVLGGTDKN